MSGILDRSAKTNWKFIGIITILGVLVIGGILMLPIQKEVPSKVQIAKSETLPVDPTANWQTYRNEEFGFEVAHPSGWRIIESFPGRTAHMNLEERPRSFGFFSPDELDSSGAGVQFYIDPSIIVDNCLVAESGLIKSNGGNNNIYGLPGGNERIREVYLCSPSGTGVYRVISTEAKQNILNQILSTFRFIEPIDTSTWKTYRNNEFGFEVKYPYKEWQVFYPSPSKAHADWESTIEFDTIPISVGTFMQVKKFDRKVDQSFEQILFDNTFLGESDKHPESFDAFSIRTFGNSSFYYIHNYLSEGQYGLIYYAVEEDQVLMFRLSGFVTLGDWLDPRYRDAEDEPAHIMLKGILSTFRFIDSSKPETFNSERIMKIVPFTDSNSSKKNLVLTFDESFIEGRNLYLANENMEEQTAEKILNIGFADHGDSPFVSSSEGEKYIVIESIGPGDTQNLIILSEEGNVIANTADIGLYPELSGYLVSFIQWESANTFSAKAFPYGQGPGRIPFELLIDAKTGEMFSEDL